VPVVSGWFQSTDYLGKSWNHLLWHGKAWSIMSTWGVFDKKYITTLERSKLEGVKIRSTLGLKKMSWSMGWGHRGVSED